MIVLKHSILDALLIRQQSYLNKNTDLKMGPQPGEVRFKLEDDDLTLQEIYQMFAEFGPIEEFGADSVHSHFYTFEKNYSDGLNLPSSPQRYSLSPTNGSMNGSMSPRNGSMSSMNGSMSPRNGSMSSMNGSMSPRNGSMSSMN
jgi:hypothetical protein